MRAREVIAVATAAVLLAGCASDTGTPAEPTPTPEITRAPEQTSSPVSAQDELLKAIENTRQADGANIEVQLITNVEGFERITAGQGYVQMIPGHGDITWTDDLGITREVVSDTGHYLELDGTWFAIDPAAGLPTTVAFDPLADLAEARNVVAGGAEVVMGRSAMRFDADLDPQVGVLSMGFSQEEVTVFADGADASLVATIWVDNEGRIVRIVRDYSASSIDGAPISATSLYLLDDLGDVRPIDVPETADAIPAPV